MTYLKIFSSGIELQNHLLAAATPQTLILVPHQRLARQLWHRQRLQNISAGRAAWEPLNCTTLGAWCAQLYGSLWPMQALAPSLTRLALWQKALAAAPPLEGTSADLTWAEALDEAHALLIRHHLDPAQPQLQDPPLVSWRRQVARIYEDLLAQENWLVPAQLPQYLTQAMAGDRLRLPETIYLAGLETPALAEEAFLSAISRLTRVEYLQVRGHPQVVEQALVFPEARDEMEWLAAQIVECRHLAKIPLNRLAVTSPAMDAYAPLLRRVLRELLGPEGEPGGWAYNFSAGPRLADTPLLAAALLPLAFFAAGERREDLVSLLLSPYCSALAPYRNHLALWDRVFREKRLEQGWEGFKAAVVGELQPEQALVALLEETLAPLRLPAAPALQWGAALAAAWEALGFPGLLDPEETLAFNRLIELLQDLAGTLPKENLAAQEFLEWMRQGAQEEVLPGPGVETAGVQVLGLLEMRGLDFDRVFCLGMNAGVFPAPPRPLPLLSPLEKSRVLGGTCASQHAFAQVLYDNLLAAAPCLTLTRPARMNDEEQVGTHLWEHPWHEVPNWRSPLSRPHPAWLPAPTVRAAFADPPKADFSPAPWFPILLPPPTELRITQLQNALSCACRFLLENLLGIRDLPDITSGLSPLERGQRLHQVLARFVREFKKVLAAQGRWDDAEAQRLLMSAARDLLAPLLSDPYWQAEWERWFGNGLTPGLLFAWLDLEKARFEDGWHWGGAEVDFQGLAQPGWPFSLKGRLDRYDFNPDLGELIVWDYKTGELPKERRVFEQKEEFQLPGYLLAVRLGLIPAPPGAASLRAGFIGLKSTRRDHLQHQDFGQDPEAWEEVVAAWEDRVGRLCRRLAAGDFRPEPVPAPSKHDQGACAYCAFPLICGFSPDETDGDEEEEA